MIRYDLKCSEGHLFEAWFASSAAYDKLADVGMIACSVCGGEQVEKALMAPRVPSRTNRRAEADGPSAISGTPSGSDDAPVLSAPGGTGMERKLAALRREIEAGSDNVGKNFAAEARRIHLGEAKERAIIGEATGAEAKSLIDDGIPVAPLPFLTRRDS